MEVYWPKRFDDYDQALALKRLMIKPPEIKSISVHFSVSNYYHWDFKDLEMEYKSCFWIIVYYSHSINMEALKLYQKQLCLHEIVEDEKKLF